MARPKRTPLAPPADGDLSTPGGRLRAARIKAGLSQSALAEKLLTQQSSICRWEKNQQTPGRLVQVAIERELNATIYT